MAENGDLMLVGRQGACPITAKPFNRYNSTPMSKRLANLTSPICELEQDRLSTEYMSILDEYQSFFQQQFSFVRALEFATSPHHWDNCGSMEIREQFQLHGFTSIFLKHSDFSFFVKLEKCCMRNVSEKCPSRAKKYIKIFSELR